jgi:DNA-binding CsgD family transcriptional regulator
MSTLTTGDVRRILDFLLELHIPSDVETLWTSTSSKLPQVIPSAFTACNQVNIGGRRVFNFYTSRPHHGLNEMQEVAYQYFHEHVLVTRYLQARDGKAYKLSDFLTENQVHNLEGLYQQTLRLMGMEDQMAIFLPTTSVSITGTSHSKETVEAVSLHRSKRDFSERDRLIFNLLSPHLFQAYQNASAFTQLQQQLNQFNRTMEQLSIIVLNAEGNIKWMAQRAWILLSQYFQVSATEQVGLPDRLQQWVRHQIRQLTQTDDIPAPTLPLRLEQDGHQLVIRLIVDRPSEQYLLLLDEQPPRTFSATTLEWLGLTKREAEVLFWVAKDKSNKEIAVILNCSDRTVKKHLEHIYEKLGVQTRAGAIVQALSRLGMLNQ